MILHEAVAKLATLIPVLKSNDAKFASDLIASYKKYGGLTPKQEPWIERLIARAETPKPVFSAPLASAVNVGGFSGVVALINKAKESGLKFPKVRLVVNGTKVIISLNGPKSKKAGHVSISGEGQYPNRAFYGSVSPEGVFSPFKPLAGLAELLTEFASNPARVAKDHGKLLGHCCFCGKLVGHGEDKRSVHAGFGPDCAERYGLKAEWLKAVEKAEAKASVAAPVLSVQDEAKASLEAGFVDDNPKDETVYDAPAAEATIEALAALDPGTEEEAKILAGADSYGPNPGDVGDLEPVAAPVDCFFCEKSTVDYKTLHGFVVCGACVDQLK